MLNPRTWLVVATMAAALLARSAVAAEVEEKRLYVTPMIGWTFFDNERLFQSGQKLNDDVYFGGRAGARLSDLLGFEVAGGWTGTKDCASRTESLTHVSGNLMLNLAPAHAFNPFLTLGLGWSRAKHAIGPSDDAATFEAAVGARVRLNETFGLRLEARNLLGRSHDGWSKSHLDDIIVGAGLTIGFGGSSDDDVAAPGIDGDADGDGVPDSRDRCPGTPKGTKVDNYGCPIVVDAKVLEKELLDTGRIGISNVNFDYDKSEIRPDAHAALDSVGKVLTKWPALRIQIDAYTDSRGTEAYNMELSHRRAESVRAYLLQRYPQLKPAQLTARNYGETNPLVPNTSAANMQKNRRVEFLVLNKEILERDK
ncbi:MAG: OmpA family protein [Candidatus Krumholzibacteriia bacterium]